jgi:predicted nucleic acid-binding protein
MVPQRRKHGLNYIFDACALISLLKKEAAFDQVKNLLIRAADGEITIYMSIINLAEVYYGFIRDAGEQEANKIMQPVSGFPITIINTISDTVYREAARFKAAYSMSLADVFLCASAKSLSAAIVTKDDEIKAAEQPETLSVFWIKK